MINEFTGLAEVKCYALGLSEEYVPFCTINDLKYLLKFDGCLLQNDAIFICRYWDGYIMEASPYHLNLLRSYFAELKNRAWDEVKKRYYVNFQSIELITIRPDLVFDLLPNDSLTLENGEEGHSVVEFIEDMPHCTFLEKSYPLYNDTIYDKQLKIINEFIREKFT